MANEGTDNPAFSHIEMDVASDKNKVNGLHIWHKALSAHEDSFVRVKHCWCSCSGLITSSAGVRGRPLLSFVALSPLHDLDISQERNQVFLALPHSLWFLVTEPKAICEIFAWYFELPGKYLLLISFHPQSEFFIWKEYCSPRHGCFSGLFFFFSFFF